MLASLALPLGRKWRAWTKQDQVVLTFDVVGPEVTGHISAAGYGRTGKAVASALQEAGLPFLGAGAEPLQDSVVRLGLLYTGTVIAVCECRGTTRS